MATHSSILAWRIPWTEEPSKLKSKGSQRVRHDWATNRDTHKRQKLDSGFVTYNLFLEKILKFGCCFVQLLSCVWLFATPWTAAHQASLSFTISWSLLRLMSIESVMPSNHLVLWSSLLLLPSVFPSISVFSSELALCTGWPKYWHFSFTSPSKKYFGWFPLGLFNHLDIQGLSRVFSKVNFLFVICIIRNYAV